MTTKIIDSTSILASHGESLKEVENRIKTNTFLQQKLLDTGNDILLTSFEDINYPGNGLGNLLMELRGELGGEGLCKELFTNSLILEKRSKNFVAVIGDPEPEIAKKLRRLGNYKRNGKTIRGKKRNIGDREGWIIPIEHLPEVEEIVFASYPDCKKIQMRIKEEIKKQSEKYLDVADIFRNLRDKKEIGSSEILFAVKDFYKQGDLFGLEVTPHPEYTKVIENYKTTVNPRAQSLLYSVIAKKLNNTLGSLYEYSEICEKLENISERSESESELSENERSEFEKVEDSQSESEVEKVEIQESEKVESNGSSDEKQEIIIEEKKKTPKLRKNTKTFLEAFLRIYSILLPISNAEKACIATIDLLTPELTKEIKKSQIKRSKLKGNQDLSEFDTYSKRFEVNLQDLEGVLHKLETVPKQCKLLILIALETLNDNPEEFHRIRKIV